MSNMIKINYSSDALIQASIFDNAQNEVARVSSNDFFGFDGSAFIYYSYADQPGKTDATIYVPNNGYKIVFSYGNQAGVNVNFNVEVSTLNNDGWKDIFVSRGHVQANTAGREAINQPNSVFRNLGNGRFAALTGEAGFEAQPARRHRGSAVGDLDGDGRPDVVVTALGEPAEIWMNDSPAKSHWLELKLVGIASNRGGIGAAIRVTSRRMAQFNHATTAVGYASSSAGPVHFGLGVDAQADQIEIRWPSGVVQRLSSVKGDRVLEVIEPSPAIQRP
jgi:hypothetical protein